jgi:hypothetical protein
MNTPRLAPLAPVAWAVNPDTVVCVRVFICECNPLGL